jgi:surfeit locus 1 family protein
MARFAMSRFFTARALGLAVVGLLMMGVMVALGLWQLNVYGDRQHAEVRAGLSRPPVPLDDVLGRDEAFPADGVSRPVTVSGRYAAREQLYIRRHLPEAPPVYAVVTPLVTANGSAVLVVRGASPFRAAVSPPPGGRISVVGLLEPTEPDGTPLSRHRTANSISISSLVSAVHEDLYDGYVIASPHSANVAGLQVVRPQLPDPSAWAGVRNLLYACQWWLFAGFVAFMWWRIVNDRGSGENDEEGRDPAPDAVRTLR